MPLEASRGVAASPYNKVTGCVFVPISLTAEPIGFSLTGQFLIGPGKVYNYFGGGYHHPPKRNHNKSIFFFSNRDSYVTLESIVIFF